MTAELRKKVTLLKGWSDISKENPDGPPTFYRHRSDNPGALQISFAEFKGGKIPDPTEDDLKDQCVDDGQKFGWGQLVESKSGSCTFGKYGMAVFQSAEHGRSQIWKMSDGKNFFFVTLIGAEDPEEIAEAQEIVNMLDARLEEKPKWKFW